MTALRSTLTPRGGTCSRLTVASLRSAPHVFAFVCKAHRLDSDRSLRVTEPVNTHLYKDLSEYPLLPETFDLEGRDFNAFIDSDWDDMTRTGDRGIITYKTFLRVYPIPPELSADAPGPWAMLMNLRMSYRAEYPDLHTPAQHFLTFAFRFEAVAVWSRTDPEPPLLEYGTVPILTVREYLAMAPSHGSFAFQSPSCRTVPPMTRPCWSGLDLHHVTELEFCNRPPDYFLLSHNDLRDSVDPEFHDTVRFLPPP